MSTIKNLIFDFGKVLVDYDFDLFFKQHIPDDQKRNLFYHLLNNENVQQIVDRELEPFDDLVGHMIEQHPEFKQELSIFRDRYTEIVTNEVPDMSQLLDQLKSEGFALYGLTNWCSKVHLTIAQFPIFRKLDGWVISSEEHLIKPEPEIYLLLCQRFNLLPEECLFTDDRPENIQGAQSVGMKAILFHSASQYEKELRAILHT